MKDVERCIMQKMCNIQYSVQHWTSALTEQNSFFFFFFLTLVYCTKRKYDILFYTFYRHSGKDMGS